MAYDISYWTAVAAIFLFLVGLSNLGMMALQRRVLPRSRPGGLFQKVFPPVFRITGKLHRPLGIVTGLLVWTHAILWLATGSFRPVNATGLLFLIPLTAALVLPNLRVLLKKRWSTLPWHRGLMIAAAVGLVVHFVFLNTLLR